VAFCRELATRGIRFAKAVAVAAQIAEPITDFATDTIVLDSAAAGQFGGSGSVFPWERAVDLRQRYPATRFILAGGLTPENVSEAISLVRPFAVDVTTGVEESPGRKNHARLRAFVAAARGA
jgi:phosphoribosylanthranilate isomerase